MEPPKPPARDTGLDGVRPDAGIEELAGGHRAVLSARETNDRFVDPSRGYVDSGTPATTD